MTAFRPQPSIFSTFQRLWAPRGALMYPQGVYPKKGHMESMLTNIQPQERAADFRQFGDPRKYNFPYPTSLRFLGVYNQYFKKTAVEWASSAITEAIPSLVAYTS